MTSDPYARAQQLRERLKRAANELGDVLDRPETLAWLSDRDELRQLGEDFDPANAEHVDRPYPFRLRAFAELLDVELGPLEHGSLDLDAASARRVAAVLRRQLAAAEGWSR